MAGGIYGGGLAVPRSLRGLSSPESKYCVGVAGRLSVGEVCSI